MAAVAVGSGLWEAPALLWPEPLVGVLALDGSFIVDGAANGLDSCPSCKCQSVSTNDVRA